MAEEREAAAGPGRFRRLPGGAGLESVQVAADQRRRLRRAMVEAAAAQGYARLTVGDVVALAGVSKSTFYELYEGKAECFADAYEALRERSLGRAATAAAAEAEAEAALAAAIGAVFELVAADPAGARAVVVEALAAGALGLRLREQTSKAFEALLGETLARTGAPDIGPTKRRTIVQGTEHMVYRALRRGELDRLGDRAAELARWACSYGPARGEAEEASEPGGSKLLWEIEPNSSAARLRYGPRERITQAVVKLAYEKGGPLSIPQISARAGVSNATFYKHFAGKQEALLAPFDAFTRGAAQAAVPEIAAAASWEESVRNGFGAALRFMSGEPEFAWVAYVEVSRAGEASRVHTEDSMALFEGPLSKAAGAPVELPETVLGAIVGGVFGFVQLAIGEGRLGELGREVPELMDFVLAPYRAAERHRDG